MSDSQLDEESLRFVQEVCGCGKERAIELLEAGSGSVERSVEIHFARAPSEEENTTRKRPKIMTKASTPSKQASLKSFFQISPSGGRGAEAAGKKVAEDKSISNETPSNDDETISENSEPKSKRMTSQMSHQKPSAVVVDKHRASDEDPRLLYLNLAQAFSEMVATTKRLAKLDALKRVLKDVIEAVGGIHGVEDQRMNDAQILQYALELILGTAGITLQVSGSAVSKAVQAVTGASSGKLRDTYRKTGDLGDASETFVRNQTLLVQPKPLTIATVHETLRKIAAQEGKGSQNQRHTLMVKLLRSCKASEMRFLVRTLLGNMRLGANVRTVLAALGHAVAELEAQQSNQSPDHAKAAKAVQDTFDFCPRLDKLSLALLCGGISYMEQSCVLEVGTALNPMLANAAHSLDEVQTLMEGSDGKLNIPRAAVAEWKYDGVRCQAHYDGSRVTLYSRHMLDNTDQFPDVVSALMSAKRPHVQSFIIDSEIVAVESQDDEFDYRLLPFQDLSTRRGSSDKDDGSSPVPVSVFAFDLLYINGESLVKKPLYNRQGALRESFSVTRAFQFAASMTLKSYDEPALRSYLEKAVAGGAEGLMIKLTGEESEEIKRDSLDQTALSCVYESGARSQTWLKVKRDYVSGYADTIDVVPIGAWYGNGRKAQKGFLSPVLLAVYDDEEDVYRSISRCMSFTDAMYEATREFYFRGTPYPAGVGMDESLTSTEATAESDGEDNNKEATESADETLYSNESDEDRVRVQCYPTKPSALINTNENPPIWFKPSEVWEVSFADLTLSLQHTAAAGLVHESRGVALRFPRFKRRRPDKRIDQATTSAQIAELFSKQSKQGSSGGGRK